MALTREGVIEAIRAGADTSPAIAERIDAPGYKVTIELFHLRRLGRIEFVGYDKTGKVGQPPKRWRVNELWQRRPRAKSDEHKAKISETTRKRWTETQFRLKNYAGRQARRERNSVGVPFWVRKDHRHVFREIARVLDEETAAVWAREAKRLIEFDVSPIPIAGLGHELR